MRVKEVMSADPRTCGLTDNLAVAAGLMWEKDCGIIPVVAESGKVVGLITDRDICMAAALKGRELANIAVADTMTGKVFSCKPDDDVRTALKTMQENRVRRLPVLTADGTLEGVLSLNDVVLKAEETKEKKPPDVSYGEVISTYKAICQHRLAAPQAQGATAG